jgi:hypothetical protein
MDQLERNTEKDFDEHRRRREPKFKSHERFGTKWKRNTEIISKSAGKQPEIHRKTTRNHVEISRNDRGKIIFCIFGLIFPHEIVTIPCEKDT